MGGRFISIVLLIACVACGGSPSTQSRALVPDASSVRPWQVVLLADGDAAFATGATFTAKLGDAQVTLAASDATHVGLLVPVLPPGHYALRATIGATTYAPVDLDLVDSPAIADPAAVVTPRLDGALADLDALVAKRGNDPRIAAIVAAARENVMHARDEFAAASAEDQQAMAQVLVANPLFLATPVATQAALGWFDLSAAQMRLVSTFVVVAAEAAAATIAFATPGGAPIGVLAGASLARDLPAFIDAAMDVIDTPSEPVDAGGVISEASGSPFAPVTFRAGEPLALALTAKLQNISADDAMSTVPEVEVMVQDIQAFEDGWASWNASLSPPLGGDPIQFANVTAVSHDVPLPWQQVGVDPLSISDGAISLMKVEAGPNDTIAITFSEQGCTGATTLPPKTFAFDLVLDASPFPPNHTNVTATLTCDGHQCGDGTCDAGESCDSCPQDCHSCVCGAGTCTVGDSTTCVGQPACVDPTGPCTGPTCTDSADSTTNCQCVCSGGAARCELP